MIKQIIKDCFFLSQKSIEATKEDLYIIDDMIDTMMMNNNENITCVGMAANMIGYLKRIIVVFDQNENKYEAFINPQMIRHFGKHYVTYESCLCHQGAKQTKRYPKIKLLYYDKNMKKKIKTFEGFTAQIIQHELDHLEGILI